MPCRNEEYLPESISMNRDLRAKIDELTKLLCETCKAGKPTHDTNLWYEQHILNDKMREAEEIARSADAVKRAEKALKEAKAKAKKLLDDSKD